MKLIIEVNIDTEHIEIYGNVCSGYGITFENIFSYRDILDIAYTGKGLTMSWNITSFNQKTQKVGDEYVAHYYVDVYDGLNITVYGYGITEQDALKNLFLNINACFWASHWQDEQEEYNG